MGRKERKEGQREEGRKVGGRHLPEVWQLAASLTFHFPQGEVGCAEGPPAGRSRWAGTEEQGPAKPQGGLLSH